MTEQERLALVVGLALLTSDRTKAEQRALVETARRVDRDWNVQSMTNRRLDRAQFNSIRKAADGTMTGPPGTYSDEHDKKACVCRGDRVAVEPAGGWSRLEAWAVVTWEQDDPPDDDDLTTTSDVQGVLL